MKGWEFYWNQTHLNHDYIFTFANFPGPSPSAFPPSFQMFPSWKRLIASNPRQSNANQDAKIVFWMAGLMHNASELQAMYNDVYIYILHMCFGGETHVFSKSFNPLQSRTPWQCCSPNQCRVYQILQEMCQLQPALSWPLRFKPLKPLIPVLLSPQSSATSRVFQGPARTAGGGCLFANYCQMAYCPSTETHILVQNQMLSNVKDCIY